jgi:hypothetical protein
MEIKVLPWGVRKAITEWKKAAFLEKENVIMTSPLAGRCVI